jgi:hypothetical protein
MIWTPARIRELLTLQNKGLSASEIAVRMGNDLTRSAVLGKLHRIRHGKDKVTGNPRPKGMGLFMEAGGVPPKSYTPEDCFMPEGIDAELDDIARA